jgi:hypothetical protein
VCVIFLPSVMHGVHNIIMKQECFVIVIKGIGFIQFDDSFNIICTSVNEHIFRQACGPWW